jgi:hypothetical protein
MPARRAPPIAGLPTWPTPQCAAKIAMVARPGGNHFAREGRRGTMTIDNQSAAGWNAHLPPPTGVWAMRRESTSSYTILEIL